MAKLAAINSVALSTQSNVCKTAILRQGLLKQCEMHASCYDPEAKGNCGLTMVCFQFVPSSVLLVHFVKTQSGQSAGSEESLCGCDR